MAEILELAKAVGAPAAVALVLTILFLKHMAEQGRLQREHDSAQHARERDYNQNTVDTVVAAWKANTAEILSEMQRTSTRVDRLVENLAALHAITKDHAKMDHIEHKQMKELLRPTGTHPFVGRDP